MIASPTYYRTRPVSNKAIDPEPDYEALRVLLKPYDPDVSIERARQIGSFLLRVNMIANRQEIEALEAFEEENSKLKGGDSE